MNKIALITVSLAMTFYSCSTIMADVIADQIADNTMSIASYHGTYEEHFGRNDAPGNVTEIWYKKPWRVRAETTAPKSLAGQLFLFDGRAMTMWWPQSLFGIRVTGFDPLDEADYKKLLEEDVAWLWGHYDFQFLGDKMTVARPATGWKASPTEKKPWLLPYTSWTDKEFSVPLRVQILDRPDHTWYEVAFTRIKYNIRVEDDLFEITLPPNAVVFDFDITDPGSPKAEIAKEMNFDFLMPTDLPRGLEVKKIIRGRHCLPMAMVVVHKNGRYITLTQMRALAGQWSQPSGVRVKIGAYTGYLNFFGPFSSLSWVQGNTALTLSGNITYTELLTTAMTVKQPADLPRP